MVLADGAGVDTWAPSWYVDPEGPAARWLRERATSPAAAGSWLIPDAVAGHRVGWFPSGLLFAEGHPVDGSLCSPAGLPAAYSRLVEGLLAADVPLPDRERGFADLDATAPGAAGLRRVDATVNLRAGGRAEGLAALAGIAACARDGAGKAEVFYGTDRAVETVYFRGHAGKRVLGRWYDKGLESASAARGTLLRAEDQRRWSKEARRSPEELSGAALRVGFHRRFAPLWRASKGVRVSGPIVVAEKLLEAVKAGEITAREAEALAGHFAMQAVGGRRGAGVSRATMYRRETRARALGVVLADGVLEEVDVDVAAVLEAALDAPGWEAAG